MSRMDELAAGSRLGFLGPPPRIVGDDPVFRYPLAMGEVAAVAHGLCADAAVALWRHNGGPSTAAIVDLRAAAASLAGASIQLLDGTPLNEGQWEPGPGERWRPWGSQNVLRGENATNPVVGLYQGGDGRWIHIHGGAPHLGDRIMSVVGGERTLDGLTRSIAEWDVFELEDALAVAETCAAVARTPGEWSAHPQGEAVNPLSAIELVRTGDAPVPESRSGPAPLAGIRVLDLGDGLAGPLCGRTLARYGADVLQIVSPDRGFIEPFAMDTGFGKRSAFLDLTDPAGSKRFGELLSEADVLCQSFRPGVLDALGFPDDVRRRISPSLITVSINCYGPYGPWAGRRGWEQLGQIATGLSLRTSLDGVPRLAPATLCDCVTGLLAAAGTMRALVARLEEGGSWDVLVSLCQTATWLLRADPTVDEFAAPPLPELDDLLAPSKVPNGTLWHPPPAVAVEGLDDDWPSPPPLIGGDPPRWADG